MIISGPFAKKSKAPSVCDQNVTNTFQTKFRYLKKTMQILNFYFVFPLYFCFVFFRIFLNLKRPFLIEI
jgi:hypothetical protein